MHSVPQVRRLIEEENSKRRKALRRHYNETVRELAAFVRKRDKRVLAHNVRPLGVVLTWCCVILRARSVSVDANAQAPYAADSVVLRLTCQNPAGSAPCDQTKTSATRLQAEEAAKRTARQAEVARKQQEDRAARAAAAAQWREPDWVRLRGCATAYFQMPMPVQGGVLPFTL